jgi:small-conductance mechanosensitive channel
VIEAALGEEGLHADTATRHRLLRVLIVMGRAIMIFAIVAQAAPAFEYRPDVEALALTLFRVSWFVCSVLLWRSRRDIVALLPQEGSPAYLRARAALASAVSYATAYFSLLFGFWAAGFDRAASALLVRSYGLVALIVVGALVQRWFDTVGERQVSEPNSVRQALEGSVDGFTRMAFYAVYAWAFLVVLGLASPLKALLAAIRIEVGVSPISLLGLGTGLVIIASAVLLSRLYRAVADHWMYPALNVEMGAGYAVDTAAHYFLMVIAFGLALVSIGIDLAALTVFMGALGVGIGFGLQDMARNFAAGFVLLFGRAVQKGDIITAGDGHYGRVEEIGARVVKVRTRDNFDLLIPSNELVNSTIINWTHENPYVRLHIDVGVGYGSDVDEVEKALLRAARQWEYTSSFNPPEVWFIEFGDNALLFQLLLWVDATQIDPNRARGRIFFPIWRELAARGIEIPFPQRDLHIRTVSDEAGAAFRGEAATNENARTSEAGAGDSE